MHLIVKAMSLIPNAIPKKNKTKERKYYSFLANQYYSFCHYAFLAEEKANINPKRETE